MCICIHIFCPPPEKLPMFYAVYHFINDILFIEVLSKLLEFLTKFKAVDQDIIKV
jgi:hypothetical protein